MQATRRALHQALLIATIAGLSACGGGGSGGNPLAGTQVTGVAATGMAIANGQVRLKCASGSTPPVSTLADGSYSVDISTVSLPCVARVDYQDSNGAAQKLHSLVQGSGNVNITPVTDMLVASLSSTGMAADAYDKLSASEVQGYTKERVLTAAQVVKTALQAKGVDTTQLPDDAIGTKLVAATGTRKGDAQDGVLDDLKARLQEQGKTLSDVENEIKSGHEKSGVTSTSSGQAGDAVAGKAAYEANCLRCHGARMPDAVNAAKILQAIKKNEGGMGALAATISSSTADNIATYMASGTGSTATVLKTQTITFASPGNQTLGVAAPALLATASSLLPVSLTSSTPVVCQVSGTSLTLLAAGSCSVSASQSGNATYNAAVPVVNTFTVASASGVVLTTQTISFASPGALTVGTPVTLSATADSGLPVTLASGTPTVCTLSGNALSLITAGTCTVTANQAGNNSFAAAASVSRSFLVSGPATLASASNGKALYASNGCGTCHGAVPATMNVLAGANSPSVIQNAISAGFGGMSTFASLTSQALADIAAYLATPTL